MKERDPSEKLRVYGMYVRRHGCDYCCCGHKRHLSLTCQTQSFVAISAMLMSFRSEGCRTPRLLDPAWKLTVLLLFCVVSKTQVRR